MSTWSRTAWGLGVVGTAILSAQIVYTPASAQQVLSFGRAACFGMVSVSGQNVARRDSRKIPVTNNMVSWTCGNTNQESILCPRGTNIIEIDRRSSGSSFLYTCLRR